LKKRRLALEHECSTKLDKYKNTIAFVEATLSNDERVGVAMVSRLLAQVRGLVAIAEGSEPFSGETDK
jgi:hypothetical protein